MKIIIWIVSHFGRNPKKGGNPPKDKIGILKIMLFFFLLSVKLNIWFKLKSLKLEKNKIIVEDKKK